MAARIGVARDGHAAKIDLHVGHTAAIMIVQAHPYWTMLLFAVCSMSNPQGIDPYRQNQNQNLDLERR